MARGKKTEKELTLEERLAEALVPVEEQPYPVPENWCWIRMGYLVNILNGFAFKSELYEDKGIRIIRITNVQDGYIEDEKPVFYPLSLQEKIAKYLLYEGDLLLSLTGNVGRTAILTSDMLPAALNQRVACIRCNNHDINRHFLFYFFLRKQFQDDCIKNSKGSAQLNMSTEWLKKQPLCVPPFAEQQRIVEGIESLFAKLDEVKEKAQAAVDSFETRKVTILHKAFTGGLTAKWRNNHNLSLSSWEKLLWGDFISSIEAGKNWLAESHPPQIGEFGVVKVSAVTWGEFNENESKTCTEMSQWNEAVQISAGDFLFSRANTLQLVGNCVIVKEINRRLMLSDKILRFKFKDNILSRYVLYYTRSNLYRTQVESLSSGNQDGMRNISQKNLKLVVFPVPSLAEQTEIVKLLDSLFSKEQSVKETAEAVLEKIETMKKAILVYAFRGELGTNNPVEESSVELLKTII